MFKGTVKEVFAVPIFILVKIMEKNHEKISEVLILFILVLLVGCSETNEKTDLPDYSIHRITDAQLSETDFEEFESIEAFEKSEIYSDIYGKYNDRAVYRLFYLNDDDIPELAVFEDYVHNSGAYIYTYNKGEVIQLIPEGENGEFHPIGNYGSFSFLPKQAILFEYSDFIGGMGFSECFYEWNGEDNILKIKNIFTKKLNSGLNSEENLQDYSYYIDGESVTEEEFSKAITMHLEPDTVVSYFKNPYSIK